MRGKRFVLAAVLAVLAPAGCTRWWCEKHGYYPAQPACQPACCVPCCPCGPTTGYAAPAAAPAPAAWNAPAGGTCAPCCPPPPPHY